MSAEDRIDDLIEQVSDLRQEAKMNHLDLKTSLLELRSALAEHREYQTRINSDLVWRLEQLSKGLGELREHYLGHDHGGEGQ